MSRKDAETIGERVRRHREALGMTRTDLTSRVGLSSQAIAALEIGATKQPSFLVGFRLAKALGVRSDELAGFPQPASIGFVIRSADRRIRCTLTFMEGDAKAATHVADAIGAIPGITIEGATPVHVTGPDSVVDVKAWPSLD